jgi:hypothetical protein
MPTETFTDWLFIVLASLVGLALIAVLGWIAYLLVQTLPDLVQEKLAARRYRRTLRAGRSDDCGMPHCAHCHPENIDDGPVIDVTLYGRTICPLPDCEMCQLGAAIGDGR